jgi:membrane-bound lytic murein transglycosylase D
MAWNRLETENVLLGQRLVFRAPAEAEVAEAPRKQPKAGAKALAAAARAASDKQMAAPQVHRVQPGDTLFNISRRFKVSVQRLREANHLTSDDVKLGQKLVVPQS